MQAMWWNKTKQKKPDNPQQVLFYANWNVIRFGAELHGNVVICPPVMLH